MIPFPDKKYQIIYADPPWKYSFPGTRKQTAKTDYPTLSLEDISAFPVKDISEPNSVLFMWGIWTGIADSLKVISAWGFVYKTVGFVWVKAKKNNTTEQYSFLPQEQLADYFGMGMWTRSNTEYCLLATKGNIKPISHSIKQVIYSPLKKHSQKPYETRDRIVQLVGDLPRIELFARQKTEGWDVWGNEV